MGSLNHVAFIDALKQIVGDADVLESKQQTAPYLSEQRGLFNSDCLAVIKPDSTDEVSQCVRLCIQHEIGLVPMGGNTGLCGGAVSTHEQIILSTEKLNQVIDIDVENYSMTVGAGCILESIQNIAAQHDRLFPLSLGAEGSCQIGGNLSTNAGGINVLHYGNARDLCLGLEAVLPDGSIYTDTNGLRKDNTGYSIKHLLIGAEGSLGIITAATLKLFPAPKESVSALIAVPDLDSVIKLYDHLRAASSDQITTFELIPEIAITLTANYFDEHPAPFDKPSAWTVLLIIQSTRASSEYESILMDALESAFELKIITDALIAQSIAQANHFLALREKIVAAQKREGASIKHDISVPVSAIPHFIQQANLAINKHFPDARPYPFGHIGDGNIHYNICQGVDQDPEEFMRNRERIHTLVLDVVHSLNGSFSAEHGIGLLKRGLIPHYKGDAARGVMMTIKRAMDPNNIMNPGKVINLSPSSNKN